MFDEYARCKFALYAAIFLAFMGYGGRITGIEPLNSQFFVFALWTYILLADNLAYRFKGNSPLISRPEEFIYLAAWSLALAGLAELLNLRLGAWHYLNQPLDISVRWTGRLAAWAGVLPSLFVTADLFRSFNFFRGLKSRQFEISPVRVKGLFFAGAAAGGAALALPGYAWPLVIPALFLLAEALNLKLGLPSLLRDLAGGLPGRTLRLASSGLACGLLWNSWNTASGASWQYNLPGWLQPLSWSVYAGFPLLALLAYSLHSLASWLQAGKGWEGTAWTMPGLAPHPAIRWAAAAIFIITSYVALLAVDAHTVKLYLGWL
jgi:hypothetical protein